MTRPGLVGDQRRPDAPSGRDEPEDERDLRGSLSRLASTLSAGGEILLSADLALDLLLNRIVQQARLATNTTGAAIALRRGDDIVCRATTGANAPELGVRLNLSSGLSGACVQTREVQSCDDTETDLRVDSVACRQLGVRSILIVPVIREQELLGVFEVFSPQPHAFGDRDVQTLHALSRRAVDSIASSAEAFSLARPSPPAPLDAVVDRLRRRDPWALVLTVLVVGLAVLLGWLLGRDGWQRTIRTMKVKSAPVRLGPQPAALPALPPPLGTTGATPRRTQLPAKNAAVADPSGALVFYQNGKVIYREKPPGAQESSPGGSSPADHAAEPARVNLPPQVAERYLTQRVEPVYPEAAREQHIQGQVLLEAIVGSEGVVRELNVVSGDPQLAIAAADAVRQWRFRPLLKAGNAVEFETRISLDFQLP
jgi:TonB family protein